jgi:hypothetical protein
MAQSEDQVLGSIGERCISPIRSSLSGFALHAAKQTADAVWLESEYYKETSER